MRFAWIIVLATPALSLAGEQLVRNGSFSDGLNGWADFATDEKREVAVVKEDGSPALQLNRKVAEAATVATQYSLKLKPQTLYKIEVTGKGEAPGHITFKSQCSKDKDYEKIAKSWATSSGPLPATKDFSTQSMVFDSGLKPDSAFLSLSVGGKAPGTYLVQRVSVEEIGSSKPRSDEKIILHIGDSITITSYLPFNERIHTLLDARFKKIMPGKAVRNINIGADGEFTQEFLQTHRYEKLIKENLERVDIAVIRYGANDKGKKFTLDDFKKNLKEICDNLKRDYPAIKIVLGTGPCVYKMSDLNSQYQPYWQVSRDLAKEREYPLLDVYAKFEADGSIKPVLGENNMHPSAYGVQLAADAEFEVLSKLVDEVDK